MARVPNPPARKVNVRSVKRYQCRSSYVQNPITSSKESFKAIGRKTFQQIWFISNYLASLFFTWNTTKLSILSVDSGKRTAVCRCVCGPLTVISRFWYLRRTSVSTHPWQTSFYNCVWDSVLHSLLSVVRSCRVISRRAKASSILPQCFVFVFPCLSQMSLWVCARGK